jgi:hypothetical protein
VHAAEFADDAPGHIHETPDAGSRECATSGSLALHEVPKLDPVPVRSRRPVYAGVLCGVLVAGILLFLWLRPALPPPRILNYTQLTDSGRVDVLSDVMADGTRVFFAAHPPGSKAQRLYQASVFDKETAEIATSLRGFFPLRHFPRSFPIADWEFSRNAGRASNVDSFGAGRLAPAPGRYRRPGCGMDAGWKGFRLWPWRRCLSRQFGWDWCAKAVDHSGIRVGLPVVAGWSSNPIYRNRPNHKPELDLGSVV